jgi:hypothetical protein
MVPYAVFMASRVWVVGSYTTALRISSFQRRHEAKLGALGEPVEHKLKATSRACEIQGVEFVTFCGAVNTFARRLEPGLEVIERNAFYTIRGPLKRELQGVEYGTSCTC